MNTSLRKSQACLAGAAALLWPLAAGAAAVTDGSTGAVQSLSGAFTVPQALGTLRGANLFHSFTRFGIANGESATFTTSNAGIRHVISRVTGGEASNFNGPLTLDAAGGASPAFWFVNPGGITVGAGAAFNVPGSLHLSTAQQLRFADGSVWDARSAGGSTLTIAAPESFGFVGNQAAAALRWQDSGVVLSPGSTLDLSGGSVTLERALLSAPQGSIRVQSPAAVTLADQTQLYASSGPADGSGGIRIEAGSLTLDGLGQSRTGLRVETLQDTSARGDAVELRVAGPLLLTGGGDITVFNASASPGGRVRIGADSLTVDGLGVARTGIGSFTIAGGTGSAIDIDVAGAAMFRRGGQVFTATTAGGASGGLNLRAGSLTLDANDGFAFVGTQSLSEATGSAGALDLRVRDAVIALGGGIITSWASNAGAAGPIRVEAGTMRLDAQGSDRDTGLQSLGAGALHVSVAGQLEILNGAGIFSSGMFEHARQPVQVQARSATLDGGGQSLSIITSATSGALPSADVEVTVTDRLQLRQGGLISSTTSGTGAAGALTVHAGSMLADGGAATLSTGVRTLGRNGGAGRVDVQVTGDLDLRSGSGIESSSSGAGEPGELRVQAATLSADGGGMAPASIASSTFGSGAAANVTVDVSGRALLRQGGQITASSLGPGAAGNVRVKAGTLDIEGRAGDINVTSIESSSLTADAGAAGNVEVVADRITMSGSANIASVTLSNRIDLRTVEVRANSITVDGQGLAGGIRSFAFGETGNAGRIVVQARDDLTLRNGGAMMAGALGRGDPGVIDVRTASLLIDGGDGQIATGILGDTVVAGTVGGGVGAAVNVNATSVEVRQGGFISTDTATVANAGSLRIVTDTLRVDGGSNRLLSSISANSQGAGAAGSIDVQARSVVIDNEGSISSSTFAEGQGGTVTINARELTLDRSGGIFTLTGGSGNAGSVVLRVADAVVLSGGGGVAANTGGKGNAGRIDVQAGSLQISGRNAAGDLRSRIVSRTTADSDGRAGNITIDVRDGLTLRDGGLLSIANESLTGTPLASAASALVVRAGTISACNADITAASAGNTGAGAISLSASGDIRLQGSTVRTTAVDGDGGPITLNAGGTLWLRNSRVTTSVEGGSNGNGGDIRISGRALVMESGFVQANTAAARARGGDVQVAVGLLVPNGSNVFLGGSRIEDFRSGVPGYNVIQAAAPEGLSGTLNVTLPQLNLSGSLAGLQTTRVDFGPLGRDLCEAGGASSLGLQGRGALSVPAAAPLHVRP